MESLWNEGDGHIRECSIESDLPDGYSGQERQDLYEPPLFAGSNMQVSVNP